MFSLQSECRRVNERALLTTAFAEAQATMQRQMREPSYINSWSKVSITCWDAVLRCGVPGCPPTGTTAGVALTARHSTATTSAVMAIAQVSSEPTPATSQQGVLLRLP